MITHIVLFKLKDKSPEKIEEARRTLMSLKGKVPSLRHIEVGVDVMRKERSYELALTAKFDDLAGLQAYQVDPFHVEVAKYISTVQDSVVAVDYES